MAYGAELSDFDKGIILGCHLSLNGLSSRARDGKLNKTKSTVASVLHKWKDDGHCDNGEHSGQPKILTNRIA